MDLGVILHAFAEEDIFKFDLDYLIFRFDENEPVVPVMDINGSRKIVTELVHRGEKSFKGKGSVEVAKDVHFR
jgi:hypothetical protein